MTVSRRKFLNILAATSVTVVTPALATRRASPRIRAIAFDAFPILDPRPIATLAEQLFPGQGKALMDTWRTRQFEYQWLRALSGQYRDFWQATDDALVYAMSLLKLKADARQRQLLMQAYMQLKAWPDVAATLGQLRQAGYRLAFLSNATPAILNAGIANSGLGGIFEHVISTDRIKTYKPDPRAYQLGTEILQLQREEILFVAFAGWDVAGAKWFGYPTFWVNRPQLPAEVLGVDADGSGSGLPDLLHFLAKREQGQHS